MLRQCFYPTVQQAVAVGLSIVGPCVLLRLLVLYSGLHQKLLNSVATALGLLVLWWYYNTSVIYFVVLCGIVYALLVAVHRQRGAVVSVACVVFIFSWYADRTGIHIQLSVLFISPCFYSSVHNGIHCCDYVITLCAMYTVSDIQCNSMIHVHGALCLECRVSWVRVPPEAAHFF